MSAAFVVRLADGPLREGRLTGRVEVVDSGRHIPFATASDLVAFLLECGRESLPADAS
jgi:hypothetical protein